MRRRGLGRGILVWAVLALGPASVLGAPAAEGEESAMKSDDERAVEAVVAAYHKALADADSAAAVGLLGEDVMVLEEGHVETAEEYLSHHLPADMEFSRVVPSERKVLRTVVAGDVAWVVSSSSMKGTFRDREVDAVGAELMVLSREDGRWRIRAIHWSSARRG